MQWHQLQDLEQLEEIKNISSTKRVLIFKHSTTCGVSAMALRGLERAWEEAEMTAIAPYYLDLKKYRSLSNQIAMDFQIIHESPQVLVISNGEAIYHASHSDIDYETLREYALARQ